jgi:hypothetical protein
MKFSKPFLIAAALLFAVPVHAQSARWVPGDGHSCFAACERAGGQPVTSGVYPNGARYTVCRANVGGEGARPGYNLQPNWSHACFVGHGGAEKSSPRYDCLCERGRDWRR